MVTSAGTYYISADKAGYESTTINVSTDERTIEVVYSGTPEYGNIINIKTKEGETYITGIPIRITYPDNVEESKTPTSP